MATTEERVHAIRAAIANSKRANSPEECDRLECVAIAELLRIARETGLDATLLKRGMREANNAKLMPAPVELNHLGEPDFGKDNDERAWLWAVLATFLNDLRVGFFRTKGGEIIIHAAKSMSEGTGSFFSKAPTRQGVDPDSEDREALYFSVVSFAAAYDARNNCGKRTAIHVAAGGIRHARRRALAARSIPRRCADASPVRHKARRGQAGEALRHIVPGASQAWTTRKPSSRRTKTLPQFV